MVTMGVFPFQGKTHMVEPGIEPGTSWLVVRSSDHQATRLVIEGIPLYFNSQNKTKRLIPSDTTTYTVYNIDSHTRILVIVYVVLF